MWDKCATMHRGRPWPSHEPRLMIRTSISAANADGLIMTPAVLTGGAMKAVAGLDRVERGRDL